MPPAGGTAPRCRSKRRTVHPRQVFRGASDALTVVERVTRVDADTALDRFTIDDPATRTSAWNRTVPRRRTGDLICAYACREDHDALSNILSGAGREPEAATKKPQ